MKKLLSFILMLLISAPVLAAVNAEVDRSTVYDGDSFQLTISTDKQSASRPDTSPLLQDFEILGTARGSSINVINGKTTAKTTWTITLRPRVMGLLKIPPLQVGGETTQTLTIRVLEPPENANNYQDIFIETEVSKSNPYVQEMVTYTVRIYLAAELTEGSLNTPAIKNAVVERLGEDRTANVNRNGRNYQVITRRYAIFPQSSGKIELPPPVLDGKVPDTRQQNANPNNPFANDPFFNNDPFFGNQRFNKFFASTRPIRVRGKARELSVLPPPDSVGSSHWLPTPQLLMTEQWDIPNELHVGAPITRTITLRAKNLMASQLPRIDAPALPNAGVYADKAVENSSDLPDGIESQIEQRIVYVPNAAGKLEVPAINIPWWNTRTNSLETASLPAREFSIISVPGAPASKAGSEQREVQLGAPRQAQQEGSPAAETTVLKKSIWPWVSAMLVFIWLGTLGLWWRDRSKARTSSSVAENKNHEKQNGSAGQHRKRFIEACELNNPAEARKALLAWASEHWPESPPQGIDELAQRLNDQKTTKLLKELDAAVYAERGSNWRGKALSESLKQLPPVKLRNDKRDTLPKLFPDAEKSTRPVSIVRAREDIS